MDLKTAIATVDKDYFDLTGEREDRETIAQIVKETMDDAEIQNLADSGEDAEIVEAYRIVLHATDDEIAAALA